VLPFAPIRPLIAPFGSSSVSIGNSIASIAGDIGPTEHLLSPFSLLLSPFSFLIAVMRLLRASTVPLPPIIEIGFRTIRIGNATISRRLPTIVRSHSMIGGRIATIIGRFVVARPMRKATRDRLPARPAGLHVIHIITPAARLPGRSSGACSGRIV
jgi:hypothetical protein